MTNFSCRAALFVTAVLCLSPAEAEGTDPTDVYEALFSPVESLGLEKTSYVREREGRFPIE